MPRPRYARTILFCLSLVGFITYSTFRFSDSDVNLPQSTTQDEGAGRKEEADLVHVRATEKSVKCVGNETLGFQKIFVVNLPERSDKLDAFVLASSLTRFTAEPLPGVHGALIPEKALPKLDKLTPQASTRHNMIGCWRAHMNFARKMIQDGLTSALVMEDDVDWSIYFKEQLSTFAMAAQYILGTTRNRVPHSPYGDNWDLLWIGHCGTSLKEGDERRFIVNNDHTMPMRNHVSVYAGEYVNTTKEGYDEHTRVMYEVKNGLCTYSYALSLEGAKKVLHWNSVQEDFQVIDIGLGAMCQDPKANFKCLSVFPTLVGSHQRAGSNAGDSDINPPTDGAVRDKGLTFNIVHSQRLNIDNALGGKKLGDGKEWKQWEDEPDVEEAASTVLMSRHPVGEEVLIEAPEDQVPAKVKPSE